MSGGHFDYQQYRLTDMAKAIRRLVDSNDVQDEWGYCRNYSAETLVIFEEAFGLLNKAQNLMQRIDYLVSGDDSEESFHKGLDEEETVTTGTKRGTV